MYLSGNKFFRIFLTGVWLTAWLSGCTEKDKAPGNGQPGGPPTLHASGYIVTPQTYYNNYTASGTIVPNEQVDIHPEISGRVTAIPFREGSRVRKGDVLVQLYDADIKAQIQKLKAQRELQVKIQERQQKLLDIGGISRQDYETTETQIASIDADIVYQEAMLRKTRIIAPFDGAIGIRGVSPGAIVSPSTLVTTLQQTHPLKIDFNVPDQFRNYMANGKAIHFTIAGNPDTLSGKISAIDPGADATTRTVKVRAVMPNPDGKITPGAFAHVWINFESDEHAILVPSQAIIPTTRDKQVAVVRNGKATITTVRTGARTQNMIHVEQGLQAGDTIITTGIMQVKPGMAVKLTTIVNDQYE